MLDSTIRNDAIRIKGSVQKYFVMITQVTLKLVEFVYIFVTDCQLSVEMILSIARNDCF